MIGLYHSRDLDGFISGAIMLRKYPDIKLIGWDYGNDLPKIPENEEIIMADISFPMDEMKKIAKKSKSFLWIDHHISAIKDFENNKFSGIKTVLNDKLAACELTWETLFPKIDIPVSVKLAGIFDTWRNGDKKQWEKAVLPFQYGLRMHCNSPESFDTRLFDTSSTKLIKKIIKEGAIILKAKKQENNYICKNSSFETEIKGFKAICLNTQTANSMMFDGVYDTKKHDIMISFSFIKDFWRFSIYTTKEDVDCSVIAKKFGGGGHKKAAGFQVNSLSEVFEKVKI